MRNLLVFYMCLNPILSIAYIFLKGMCGTETHNSRTLVLADWLWICHVLRSNIGESRFHHILRGVRILQRSDNAGEKQADPGSSPGRTTNYGFG